jgi:cytochrome c oxidase subunit IV
MTDTPRHDREFKWLLWRGPAVVWLVLIVLFGASLGSAYLPLGASNVAVNLVLAAVMVGLLVTFLMDLQNSPALIRIVAAAGLLWTIFMFALTFNDYLSRRY